MRWMVNKSNFKISAVVVLVLLFLPACTPELLAALGGGGSWIDKPLTNSQIPMAPYEVVSHASSPDGIAAFELSVDGQQVAMNDVGDVQFGNPLAYISQIWTPDMPGMYELSVRAMDMNGEFGPSAVVIVEVVDEQLTQAEPTATGTPAEVGAELPETGGECTFIASANLFCRLGGDTRFEIVDSLTPGQMAPVVGMSTDTFYWYVIGPLSNRMCTVPSAERYGMVTGDCSGIPQFTPMPTPVDTPTTVPEASDTPTSVPPTPTWTPIPDPR